jgi:cellulose synthase (UDP-forming)
MRAMDFFEDPKVGIVQIPHTFYNSDPMQVNLGSRKAPPPRFSR